MKCDDYLQAESQSRLYSVIGALSDCVFYYLFIVDSRYFEFQETLSNT